MVAQCLSVPRCGGSRCSLRLQSHELAQAPSPCVHASVRRKGTHHVSERWAGAWPRQGAHGPLLISSRIYYHNLKAYQYENRYSKGMN
jgi:hypothetical protein